MSRSLPFAHLALLMQGLALQEGPPLAEEPADASDLPMPSPPRRPTVREAFPKEWEQVRRARAQVEAEQRFVRALTRRFYGPVTEEEHLERLRRHEEAVALREELQRQREEAEHQRELTRAARAVEVFVRSVLEHGEAAKLEAERVRRREACAAREEARGRRAKARKRAKGKRGW